MTVCEICTQSFAHADVLLDPSGCFFTCRPCAEEMRIWEESVGLRDGLAVTPAGEEFVADLERKLAVFSAEHAELHIIPEDERAAR